MTRMHFTNAEDPRPAACGNCQWSGRAGEAVQPVRHLEQRIEAGDVVPVGECPECGALCYLVPPPPVSDDQTGC